MIEPAAGSEDVVSFGPFSLDPRRRLLLKDGAPVVVGARTLDTLIALVARPNEAISKRELMAVVWPDVIVEEGSLCGQIAALRKALGDGKGGARYITTLAGRGYCFVAPITRVRDRGSERAAATIPALAIPDKPSIAVLAFQNMSGDPNAQAALLDGDVGPDNGHQFALADGLVRSGNEGYQGVEGARAHDDGCAVFQKQATSRIQAAWTE